MLFGGFKWMPMRSLDDFLLGWTKYHAPPLNDLKRFNNRVTSNLLYYQTNYFAISAITFSLFLVLGSDKMASGACGIASTVGAVLFYLDRIPMKSVSPVLFLSLSVLIPISFWISHAAVRNRGLKNRITNKMEQLGAPIYTDTPMGCILSALGLETTRDHDE